MIELYAKPGEVVEWDEFCETHPQYSLALDGYVRGGPKFQSAQNGGPRANFNHHEDVDRLSTLCTASQVFYKIKGGLFECFQRFGIPQANVYVNDPDQDVSLAVWLLKNNERIKGDRSEPLINTLVSVGNKLDVFGGNYPMDPTDRILRQYDWIFEPYTAVRQSGRLCSLNGQEIIGVIDAVGKRITDYTLARGGELPVDVRYDVLGGGPGWKLIREVGSRARLKLAKDGVTAFISVLNQRPDKKWTYTLGRLSEYIDFDIPGLYDYLNDVEGFDDTTGWGGGNTIGGSPRKTGSSLPPKELEKEVNNYIASKLAHA